MSQNPNVQKIRDNMNNALPYEIIVTIKGQFLVTNNLVEAWRTLRGMSPDAVIDSNFEDIISISQSESLGIITTY